MIEEEEERIYSYSSGGVPIVWFISEEKIVI